MTQITVALSETLKARISSTAEIEGRNRNNWATRLLTRAIEEYEADPEAFMRWQQTRKSKKA